MINASRHDRLVELRESVRFIANEVNTMLLNEEDDEIVFFCLECMYDEARALHDLMSKFEIAEKRP